MASCTSSMLLQFFHFLRFFVNFLFRFLEGGGGIKRKEHDHLYIFSTSSVGPWLVGGSNDSADRSSRTVHHVHLLVVFLYALECRSSCVQH